MNFRIKFTYQVVVCNKRHVTKKHFFSKTQEISSPDCPGLDLVATTEMKLEALILKGFLK